MYPRTASFTESGKLRDCSLDLFQNFVFELRVYREGHLQNVFERGLFEFAILDTRRSAEAGKIETVNGLYHVVQLSLIFGAIRGHRIRCLQHQIDSGIEFPARGGKIFSLVEPFSCFVAPSGPFLHGVAGSWPGR